MSISEKITINGKMSRNKVSLNTFKNTPEDDLDMFCGPD
jgi:hypothetical protein